MCGSTWTSRSIVREKLPGVGCPFRSIFSEATLCFLQTTHFIGCEIDFVTAFLELGAQLSPRWSMEDPGHHVPWMTRPVEHARHGATSLAACSMCAQETSTLFFNDL